jgi:hypothetical protein
MLGQLNAPLPGCSQFTAALDQTGPVGLAQGPAHLTQEVDRSLQGERALPAHQLTAAGEPAVEIGFGWRIEAEPGEPRLAGHGRNPVFLKTLRGGRTEVEVHRSVRVFQEVRLAGNAIGNLLFVLDQVTRVHVVERDGPELLRRWVGWHV